MRPAACPCATARVAPARAAVDRAIRDAPGGEPRLHVGQRAGAAGVLMQAIVEAMFVSYR